MRGWEEQRSDALLLNTACLLLWGRIWPQGPTLFYPVWVLPVCSPHRSPPTWSPPAFPQGNLPQQRSPELIVWRKKPQMISFCLFAYKFNSLVAEKSSPARFWLHFVFFLPLGVDFATGFGARCVPSLSGCSRTGKGAPHGPAAWFWGRVWEKILFTGCFVPVGR